MTKINGPGNLSCITSLRTREEGKYIVIEKLKEKCLMKSSFSSENQQAAFISTVWRFYGVVVHNFEGLSTSLWVDNVQVQ